MNIQEIAKTVRDAIEGKSKAAFFVGAGISMEGGICLGFQSLNERVLVAIAGGEKEFKDYLVKQRIAENERARPEIVLQIAINEISPQVISCLDILIDDNLNLYHRLLARTLQAGNWVFTTNFENRIEKACEEIGFKPEVCSSDEDFYRYLFRRRQKGERLGGYLFKLHGTINEKESVLDKRFETIAMTLNEVGRGLSRYKAEVLRTFLLEYEFIFLGYRCMDEFDINDVLLNAKSDRPVVYFCYKERPEYKPEQGKLPLVISDRKSLQDEKSQEGQDRSIIHINDLLLGRPKFYKVVGNPRNLMNEIYQSIAKPNPHDQQTQVDREYGEAFPWAQDVSDDKRRLFFGRLLLHLGLWGDAIECLSKIKGEERGANARARRCMGDAWRETEERAGYEEAIKSFQDSWKLFEQDGDLASAEVAKAEMANVMRLAGKSVSDAEKYLREAKQVLEREILLGYAAILNILGLVCYGKRFEEEWRRGYWLEIADDFCEKSMRIGEIIGDQARIARAGNALSLVLNDQAKLYHDKDKIIRAINLLDSLLPGREAAWDLRLCFQIPRNLEVTHSTKMLFIEDEGERNGERQEALKSIVKARRYAEVGQMRMGQYLETFYREGQLQYELGNYSEAVPPLKKYVQEQGIPDRKATGFRFLGLAYAKSGKDEQASESFKEVVRIYGEMPDSQHEELKRNPDRKLRAKENLSEAVKFFEQQRDEFMTQKAKELIKVI